LLSIASASSLVVLIPVLTAAAASMMILSSSALSVPVALLPDFINHFVWDAQVFH
jgi:hypothetical protein